MSSALAPLLKVMKVSVELSKGPSQGEKFSFEKPTFTVGRGPENDVVISQDVKVSRHHLQFQVVGNMVTVRNLSSKNPISVDGDVTSETNLRPGAIVRLGDTELKISFEKPPEPKPVLAVVPAPGGSVPAAPNPAFPPMQNSMGSHEVGAAANHAGMTAFPKPPPVAPTFRPAPPMHGGDSSKVKIYVIIAVIIGAVAFFSKEQARKRQALKLRDSISTEIAISDSQKQYDETMKQIEKSGQDTIQYKLAQEQYWRGFRDYRQGQYMRAMEEFQAALSFFPSHDLARKYYMLAKRKFDEEIQQNMIEGKRYYGISNYRLCMAYYSNVIKMKKDERDPIRREAKQYYDECELKMRGKF